MYVPRVELSWAALGWAALVKGVVVMVLYVNCELVLAECEDGDSAFGMGIVDHRLYVGR